MRIFKQSYSDTYKLSNSNTYKLSYSDNYKLSYSDLFRVSIDPRVKPEGDRKESVPEGDERGKKPEGNNYYIVMPRFGTNRPGIFELGNDNFKKSSLRAGTRGQAIFELVFFTLVSSTSIAKAECTPTPDCASIGYTETSCDGKFVRCPFDTSKLFCVPCDNDYKYTCIGDNIVGSVGNTCGGKYASCECIIGASFTNGECICDTSCSVGNIYYSDGSCSSCIDSFKFIAGVVVKENELVMSKDHKTISWGGYGTDIANLNNYSNGNSAKDDYLGFDNTSKIVAQFGSANIDNYAGVYCNNYYPQGMENSKGKWYLPAIGELYSNIYNNYHTISTTYSTQLEYGSFNYYLWSSTEGHSTCAWAYNFQSGNITSPDKNHVHSLMCFLKI